MAATSMRAHCHTPLRTINHGNHFMRPLRSSITGRLTNYFNVFIFLSCKQLVPYSSFKLITGSYYGVQVNDSGFYTDILSSRKEPLVGKDTCENVASGVEDWYAPVPFAQRQLQCKWVAGTSTLLVLRVPYVLLNSPIVKSPGLISDIVVVCLLTLDNTN